MFDSLKYAKKLEDMGVPRRQAEAHVQILSEVMETSLATKEDIKDVRHDMQLLKREIVLLEQRLTIKLGTIVSLAIGIAVALTKLVA